MITPNREDGLKHKVGVVKRSMMLLLASFASLSFAAEEAVTGTETAAGTTGTATSASTTGGVAAGTTASTLATGTVVGAVVAVSAVVIVAGVAIADAGDDSPSTTVNNQ